MGHTHNYSPFVKSDFVIVLASQEKTGGQNNQILNKIGRRQRKKEKKVLFMFSINLMMNSLPTLPDIFKTKGKGKMGRRSRPSAMNYCVHLEL